MAIYVLSDTFCGQKFRKLWTVQDFVESIGSRSAQGCMQACIIDYQYSADCCIGTGITVTFDSCDSYANMKTRCQKFKIVCHF